MNKVTTDQIRDITRAVVQEELAEIMESFDARCQELINEAIDQLLERPRVDE